MIDRLQQGFRRADALQQRHVWLSFPVAVVRKMSDDGGSGLAAQIGYYGFLSVFPLLLVFAAVLGYVLAGHSDQVVKTAESSFPSLSSYIKGSIKGNSLALGLGLLGALWAGLGVTRATERAMNNIWDIPISERPSLWWSRLRGLGMLCILGATFLASTLLAALREVGGGVRPLTETVGIVGPLALNFVLFLLAFQVLTNRHLAWRALVPGAIAGGVGWTLLQSLGAYFVRHSIAHASHLYGSLATVVGILIWIYLGAQLTLYAAEMNVVLVHRLWPRSLSRKRASTEADRRAVDLAVRKAEPGGTSGTDEPGAGAPSEEPSPVGDTRGGPEPLEDLVVHLTAMEHCRDLLATGAPAGFDARRHENGGADGPEPEEVRRSLDNESAAAARALDELLARDPELATAFGRARHAR